MSSSNKKIRPTKNAIGDATDAMSIEPGTLHEQTEPSTVNTLHQNFQWDELLAEVFVPSASEDINIATATKYLQLLDKRIQGVQVCVKLSW